MHAEPIDRPLRIALLTHSTNPRGGVVHALELGEALKAAGHEVAVHAPSVNGAGFFRETRCDTVRVPAAPVRGGLADLVAQRIDEYVAYFERVGTDGWDILHAQDSMSANALAELTSRGLARGFVRTVHHLDHFHDPRLMAWQTQGVLSADRVLCVSRVWADNLRRSHGVEAVSVPNGVDLARFNPVIDAADRRVTQRYGLDPSGPVLLAVGGVEARKNSIRLLEAFLRIRRTHPDAQLVIAGGVSLLDHSVYRAQFDGLVRDSGLSVGPGAPIVLTGAVPDEDMPALYRCADLLVFPSIKEGFGLVVLEAMACGTPVVTSRIAPFTEYLQDGDVSWAQPLDVDSIASAIRMALQPHVSARLRAAGRQVSRRFGWAACAEQHLAAYAQFLEHAHA
jgi:glycosyltransferase-like protein